MQVFVAHVRGQKVEGDGAFGESLTTSEQQQLRESVRAVQQVCDCCNRKASKLPKLVAGSKPSDICVCVQGDESSLHGLDERLFEFVCDPYMGLPLPDENNVL